MQLCRNVEDRTEETEVDSTESERANGDTGNQLAKYGGEFQVTLEYLAAEFGSDKDYRQEQDQLSDYLKRVFVQRGSWLPDCLEGFRNIGLLPGDDTQMYMFTGSIR